MIATGAAVMSVLVLLRFVDLFSVVQTQAVQLAALARTDALTGAANRRTWDHELSRACQFARDHHRRLSVAILDIDHFKAFNDTFGHKPATTSCNRRSPPGPPPSRQEGSSPATGARSSRSCSRTTTCARRTQ